MQGALETAGPFAADLARLFWIFVGVAAVVYAVVIGFLVYALRRRRLAGGAVDTAAGTPPAALRAVGTAVVLTAAIFVTLAVADFLHHRVFAANPPGALQVRVTAHQWWWDVEYVDANPSRRVRTANQLVIPVDRPVTLQLGSADVIHSFWVPSLQGKRDLLPGYTTSLAIRASRPGTYGGECAEFCGFQHANMRIDVQARTSAEYSGWVDAQLAPAREPDTDLQRRGRDVFLNSSCVMCHAINGTDAGARLGPDLTHLASRRTIAAGRLPNDARNLAAWITDPQSLKPGTRMPATPLSPDDTRALVGYLVSLK